MGACRETCHKKASDTNVSYQLQRKTKMVSGTQMLEFAQKYIIAAEDSELPTISHHQKNQHMPVKQNPLVICNQQTVATESEIQINITKTV